MEAPSIETAAALLALAGGGGLAAMLIARRRREGRLAEQVARAHAEAIDASGDGVLVIDADGWLVDKRGAAAESLIECVEPGRDGRLRLPAVLRDRLSRAATRPLRVKAGSICHLEIWWSEEAGSRSRHALRGLLVRDITRQRTDERNLIRLAHYDSLTGMPNRRLFLRTLKRHMESARSSGETCALLYIDVDHFKEVNDSFGHGVGDELLKQLAARLMKCLRPEEFDGSTLSAGAAIHLARLSGDEFAVIVSKVCDAEGAREIVKRAQKSVAEPIEIGGRFVPISLSIGVALFPKDGDDVQDLIHSADTAVYEAKRSGRGCSALYEASVTAEREKESRLAQAIRQAISRSELDLHYQPKIEVASGTTVGLEALVRWQSPEFGPVSPADFIPIAEERGVIQEIGAWCLDQACQSIRRWREEGFVPVPVSVNVSSVQFREDDLQRTVTDALKRHDVEPELIEIELTESLLLAEGDATQVCLRDLRAIGVGIALDDFGTGYSALAYLNVFPLDVLKLDRAFLREIHLDSSAARLVRSVISMAHAIGLKVVAEGVDDPDQVPLLAEMRCDQIQGFLYSPAIPANDVRELLARPGGAAPKIPFATESVGRRSAVQIAEEPDLPAIRFPHRAEEREAHGLLLVDDGASSLEPFTTRLLHLGLNGVDLQYASMPDEAQLLVAQEGAIPNALVAPPTLDSETIGALRDAMAGRLGSVPPVVVIGEEPTADARSRLRKLGGVSVLWLPFDDVELAFLLRAAVTPRDELSRRRNIRVPVNLVARLQTGQHRESVMMSSLSSRGAFLQLSDPPQEGAVVRLEFDLATETFRLFARVVNLAQEDPDYPFSESGISVAFFGAERAVELRLTAAVEGRAARYQP